MLRLLENVILFNLATRKPQGYVTQVSDQLSQPKAEAGGKTADNQPQTSQAKSASSTTDDQLRVTRDENWLWIFELITVGVLLIFILSFFTILFLWTACGWCSEIYQRSTEAVKFLNENWKVCALILVPLFFRPLRKYWRDVICEQLRLASTQRALNHVHLRKAIDFVEH
jgi:predicted membrane protein